MNLDAVTVGTVFRAKRRLHDFVPAGAVGVVTRIMFGPGGYPLGFRVQFQLQNYHGVYVSIELQRDADSFELADARPQTPNGP